MATLVIVVSGNSMTMHSSLFMLSMLGGRLRSEGYKVEHDVECFCWIDVYGDICCKHDYSEVLNPYLIDFNSFSEDFFNVGEDVLVGDEQKPSVIERVFLDSDGISLRYICSDGNEYESDEVMRTGGGYMVVESEDELYDDEEYDNEEDEGCYDVDVFGRVCRNFGEYVNEGYDLDMYNSMKKLLYYFSENISDDEIESDAWIRCLGYIEKRLISYEED